MKGTIWPRPYVKDPETGARRPVKGSTWTYQFTVTRSGKRKNITKGGFRTKSEAQDALNAALADHQHGDRIEPTKLTVREYLEAEWLPLQKASRKPSTYTGYEHIASKRIIPTLGDLRLSELTAGDVARLYSTLRTSGRLTKKGGALGERSIRHTHAVLHSALEHAVDAGMLGRNPARRLPKAARPNPRNVEMRTWSAEELRTFLASFDGEERAERRRLRAPFLVAALTGLRRSELCGLKWEDVDLERCVLSVRRGLTTAGYQVHEGAPKSGRARTVALDAETVAVLRRWRADQLQERLAAGEAWSDSGYMFTIETGEPWHPQLLADAFQRRVDSVGVAPIRFHDLRHTHATLMLAAGVHPKVVQERLGHSSISITLDLYSHVAPGMQEDAAAKVGELVFG